LLFLLFHSSSPPFPFPTTSPPPPPPSPYFLILLVLLLLLLLFTTVFRPPSSPLFTVTPFSSFSLSFSPLSLLSSISHPLLLLLPLLLLFFPLLLVLLLLSHISPSLLFLLTLFSPPFINTPQGGGKNSPQIISLAISLVPILFPQSPPMESVNFSIECELCNRECKVYKLYSSLQYRVNPRQRWSKPLALRSLKVERSM
jgi:hypothetical protein